MGSGGPTPTTKYMPLNNSEMLLCAYTTWDLDARLSMNLISASFSCDLAVHYPHFSLLRLRLSSGLLYVPLLPGAPLSA